MPKTLTAVFTGFIALLWCLGAHAQYTVESLPNPKSRGQDHFVSDPDANLSAGTVAELDALAARIEAETGSEFAVAVVNDYAGDSDFRFALDLFTHWGIGKRGADNGLLLFLAMERREYRFVTGYGVEGIFPDALLKRIGETYLVPYLQAGNTDMAVLAAAKAVESVLLSPDHALELANLTAYQPTFWNRHAGSLTQTLWVLGAFGLAFVWISRARERVVARHGVQRTHYGSHPFWFALVTYGFLLFLLTFVFLFTDSLDRFYQIRHLPGFAAGFGMLLLLYHYHMSRHYLGERTLDAKTRLDMQVAFARLAAIPLLLSPLAWRGYYVWARQSREARARQTPPTRPGQWTRLNRDALAQKAALAYLTPEQACEERIGARAYEIWQDAGTGSTQIVAFPGAKARQFSACPECHAEALGKPEVKVRQAATRSREGSGERLQYCRFCDYKLSLGMVVLAKLSDGSGAGGSGGAGGGGSSSGGSFGGGSSGGGGAGGRW